MQREKQSKKGRDRETGRKTEGGKLIYQNLMVIAGQISMVDIHTDKEKGIQTQH